jgi:hypothetical protein
MEKLICFGIGCLGVVVYMVIKMASLDADAKNRNVDFSINDYLKKDRFNILLSFLAVVLWVVLFEEAVTAYPKIQNFLRLSFAGMGLTGSLIIQKLNDKSKKYINDQAKN